MTLNNTVSGIDIDLGGGNDTVNLATGVNSLSVENVELINSTDFNRASPSDDTLTLLNDVSGLTVNLANGTNTLQLAAGTNSLVNVFGVQNINGSATDDTLTIQCHNRRPRRRQRYAEPERRGLRRHRAQRGERQRQHRQ